MKREAVAVGILAIAIIGMLTSIDSIAEIPGSERAALIALYEDTFGDDWTNNSGWKGNNNESDGFSEIGSEGSWRGSTVVGNHVTKIRLYTNGLTGSLPSELEDLQYLEELVFYVEPGGLCGGDNEPCFFFGTGGDRGSQVRGMSVENWRRNL